MHFDLQEDAYVYEEWFKDQYGKIISDNIEEIVKNVKPSKYYKYTDKVSSISLSGNDLIIKYNNFLTCKVKDIKYKAIEYVNDRIEIDFNDGFLLEDIFINHPELYIDSYPTVDESLIELLKNTDDNSNLPELKPLLYKQALWHGDEGVSVFIEGKFYKKYNVSYTLTDIETIKTIEQLSNLWDFAEYLIDWNDKVVIEDTHIKNKKDFIIYLVETEIIDIDISAEYILHQLLKEEVIDYDDIDGATAEILTEMLDDKGV